MLASTAATVSMLRSETTSSPSDSATLTADACDQSITVMWPAFSPHIACVIVYELAASAVLATGSAHATVVSDFEWLGDDAKMYDVHGAYLIEELDLADDAGTNASARGVHRLLAFDGGNNRPGCGVVVARARPAMMERRVPLTVPSPPYTPAWRGTGSLDLARDKARERNHRLVSGRGKR